MSTLKITQVRSGIDRPQRQIKTLQALGLGKINKTVELPNNPQVAGMVKAVAHLLKIG